jgi:hypothetical protein
MNDNDDDEEKMDEENHDAYRSYVIDDEARNDPIILNVALYLMELDVQIIL